MRNRTVMARIRVVGSSLLFYLLTFLPLSMAAEDVMHPIGCRRGTPRQETTLRRAQYPTSHCGGDFYEGTRRQLVVLASFNFRVMRPPPLSNGIRSSMTRISRNIRSMVPYTTISMSRVMASSMWCSICSMSRLIPVRNTAALKVRMRTPNTWWMMPSIFC